MTTTQRIEQAWDTHAGKMDWLAMEQCLADILRDNTITDALKVLRCKECLDAYTKRGHFDATLDYPPHHPR